MLNKRTVPVWLRAVAGALAVGGVVAAVVVAAEGGLAAPVSNWPNEARGPKSDAALAPLGALLEPENRSGAPGMQTAGLTPVDDGQIVYDGNLNVYWLANANLAGIPQIRDEMGVAGINPDGTMTYTVAQKWVRALDHADYLGHDNWQLPVMPDQDPTCAVAAGRNSDSFGPNCTGSTLGNLYGVGLGLRYPSSVFPGFTNTVTPFHNLQPSPYWTSDPGPDGTGQRTVSFISGVHGENTTTYNYFYVLPMKSGAIGSKPTGTGLVPYDGGLAVYDSAANVTWALDADLAASDNFGVTGTTTLTTAAGLPLTVPLINGSGAMLLSTVNTWLTGMNTMDYAGSSHWVSPTVSEVLTLYADLMLEPGDRRLMTQGSVGPFEHLQPFFYWACPLADQGLCSAGKQGTNPQGGDMAWSFNLDTGFQGNDLYDKEFYVEVYYQPYRVYLPMVVGLEPASRVY